MPKSAILTAMGDSGEGGVGGGDGERMEEEEGAQGTEVDGSGDGKDDAAGHEGLCVDLRRRS